MKLKNPFIATLSDVRIERDSDGETAIISYRDKTVSTTFLKIGPQIAKMSKADILACHNQCIRAQKESRQNYHHIAREIPPGKPQIEYFKRGDQWVPRGEVLRCEVSGGGEDFEPTFLIDDQELSLREFGRMMAVWTGWGIRIICVPDDELYHNPPITICESKKGKKLPIILDPALYSEQEH